MSLAPPSLGFCGPPLTLLSWGGEASPRLARLRAKTARPQTPTTTSVTLI